MRAKDVGLIVALFLSMGMVGAEETVPNLKTDKTPGVHEFDFAPPGPEARKELSVKREENFEFAALPRVTRAGDRAEISFETRAFCDATVAIEDANGKIVRHLASGVLGDNAPSPFAKNIKKQCVVWDGKDDFGVFIDDEDALTVRVSLGLKANFEKALHWNPMQFLGRDVTIRAAPEGVYAYCYNINKVWDSLKLFDHAGRYVKTLHPFPVNLLDKVMGLNWIYAWPEERKIPAKYFDMHGSLLPFRTSLFGLEPPAGAFTVKNGWITLIGSGVFARLAADGTTRGQNLTGGPTTLTKVKQFDASVARRAASSPDGKWIYLTRAYANTPGGDAYCMYSRMDQAVYRMPADGSSAPQVFIGDPHKRGSDNDHFNLPSGIAVDSKGRIYVSDWDNDRVQIFSAEGKFIKTINTVGSADIALNQKTGDIYVFSCLIRPKGFGYAAADETRDWGRGEGRDGDYNLRGSPIRVKKYAPLDAGAGLIYEQNLTWNDKPLEKYAAVTSTTHFEVDGWAPQTTIWWERPGLYGAGPARICVMKEENNKLVEYLDFEKELEKAGFQTGYGYYWPCSLQRQFLFFDPKHQVLYVAEPNQLEVKYFSNLLAIDVATGKERVVKLPFAAADAAIDAKGRIYLLNDDVIARYDLDTWQEIPFDYGVKRPGAISAIQTIGGHYSSYKHQSLGVSPNGDVIVAGMKGVGVLDRRRESARDYGKNTWSPVIYPGRAGGTNIPVVNVFDIYGELAHEDVLPGVGACTGGLDLDWQGNIYAAIPAARILDKHIMRYCTGTLVNYGPNGGRIICGGAGVMAPLDVRPAEPSREASEGGMIWMDGARWKFAGTPMGLMFLNCKCREARFKTDYYGRSFVPEAWRYSVAVLDTAGNVMLRIGQYGNADSAGPKSLVPLGGDEIGLFDAQFVTMDTDRRVFIGDGANGRIVSGLLSYHTNRRIALKEIPDEARK